MNLFTDTICQDYSTDLPNFDASLLLLHEIFAKISAAAAAAAVAIPSTLIYTFIFTSSTIEEYIFSEIRIRLVIQRR